MEKWLSKHATDNFVGQQIETLQIGIDTRWRTLGSGLELPFPDPEPQSSGAGSTTHPHQQRVRWRMFRCGLESSRAAN
jgi:hypothetical protein